MVQVIAIQLFLLYLLHSVLLSVLLCALDSWPLQEGSSMPLAYQRPVGLDQCKRSWERGQGTSSLLSHCSRLPVVAASFPVCSDSVCLVSSSALPGSSKVCSSPGSSGLEVKGHALPAVAISENLCPFYFPSLCSCLSLYHPLIKMYELLALDFLFLPGH